MLGIKKIANRKATDYAVSADFCRIFQENMHSLYLLSYLLTGDHAMAEQCFVRGLEACKGANAVFKEWAQSWARRMIITNAIRVLGPSPGNASKGNYAELNELPTELAAVARLNTFDRLVFVMSVLEGYAERDCRILLQCSASDTVRARTRALQQLGALVESYGETENTIQSQSKDDDRELTLVHGLLPRLAVSA